jgi:hypothetical protein
MSLIRAKTSIISCRNCGLTAFTGGLPIVTRDVIRDFVLFNDRFYRSCPLAFLSVSLRYRIKEWPRIEAAYTKKVSGQGLLEWHMITSSSERGLLDAFWQTASP